MNVPGALDTVKLSVSARERHCSMRARKVVFGLVLTVSLTGAPAAALSHQRFRSNRGEAFDTPSPQW